MTVSVLGVTCLITLFTKLILHNRIEVAHKREKPFEWLYAIISFKYFLPYWKPVKKEYRLKKIICNVLYLLLLALIFLSLFYSEEVERLVRTDN
jgi:hypothetical protein